MLLRLGSAICIAFNVILNPIGSSAAQSQTIEEANQITLGIIGGSVSGTYARFAQDLSNLLDTEGELRVLPILGKGSIQNVKDLLKLQPVDIAMVQSDVLEHMKKVGEERRIEECLGYISKLYNEEVHLIARGEIKSIDDLNGEFVNIGGEGSGTAMTASIVFEKLGIQAETLNLNNEESIAALQAGDIAAAFLSLANRRRFLRNSRPMGPACTFFRSLRTRRSTRPTRWLSWFTTTIRT